MEAVMAEQEPGAGDADLESLATGIELTLASVLQGIAMAILIPKVAELIVGGEVAKLPYIPASLLLIFIVWVAFVVHSLSFITWPFDLTHNLLYFLVVTAETVLLSFLDQPAPWFLALAGFGLVMGINHWYNLRLLRRYQRRYTTPARQALYGHIAADQRTSLAFMAGYIVVGLFCAGVLRLQPEFGLPEELGWVIAGLVGVLLPAIHVAWQFRLVAERSKLIAQAKREAAV
jgi:hypothetical protein